MMMMMMMITTKRLILLLLLCPTLSMTQVDTDHTDQPPDGHRGYEDDAFFALRSCHQLLRGDTGEFFSPDYLCSNPALWCNWTIQVDPGKRLHLHLEDFTPEDACQFKQDQVHVDEPGTSSGVHKILQKCWREAKYTTSSNTVNVVLLIGGWPSSPYRGFYGWYQAFGPPIIYNPQEVIKAEDEKSEPKTLGHVDDNERINEQEVVELYQPPLDIDPGYDYHQQQSAIMERPLAPEPVPTGEDSELVENIPRSSGWNLSHDYPITAVPTVPPLIPGTSRSQRNVPASPLNSIASDQHQGQPNERLLVEVQSDMEEDASVRPRDAAAVPEDEPSDLNRTEESLPSVKPSTSHEPEETEPIHPHPNMVEPLSDYRGRYPVRNHSDVLHLPGDHLFEVSMEVNFSLDVSESWDEMAKLLLLWVKNLVSEQLGALETPWSLTTKRIKRLDAGGLYIFWLQTQNSEGQQLYRAIYTGIQGLVTAELNLKGIHKRAVIISVSTADVNECGTQLVRCDLNADCVNHFGSYSCLCRPGFLDKSRHGSGGTLCMDANDAGCSSGLSAETKAVYVLFFLLSSVVFVLLAAGGVFYHRHRRGTFLVQCHSDRGSAPDFNNNKNSSTYRGDGCSDLPAPPPPPRGPALRETWPQVKDLSPVLDLPLLRFNPLSLRDGYVEPREGGKL